MYLAIVKLMIRRLFIVMFLFAGIPFAAWTGFTRLPTGFSLLDGASMSNGAGGASRQALGTAVFGGMIAATFLAVLFVPVFYKVLQSLSEKVSEKCPHVSS